jgi:hypothetical protein
MKSASKLAVAALIGVGALTLGAANASAAVVCNGAGECWHVRHHYHYHPGWGLAVHPDNWRWRHEEHYVWREHHGRGRGYWRNGVWVTF